MASPRWKKKPEERRESKPGEGPRSSVSPVTVREYRDYKRAAAHDNDEWTEDDEEACRRLLRR